MTTKKKRTKDIHKPSNKKRDQKAENKSECQADLISNFSPIPQGEFDQFNPNSDQATLQSFFGPKCDRNHEQMKTELGKTLGYRHIIGLFGDSEPVYEFASPRNFNSPPPQKRLASVGKAVTP